MYAILYVDDEEINLRGFKMLFEEQYKIHTATSGKKGLEILKEHPEIKLIITDQRMPEMTGVEFLSSNYFTREHQSYFNRLQRHQCDY